MEWIIGLPSFDVLGIPKGFDEFQFTKKVRYIDFYSQLAQTLTISVFF